MSNWIQIDRTSGTGNGVVHVTIPKRNTGRLARTTTLTFHADGGVIAPVRTIVQSGRPEFVDVPSQIIIPKEGGRLVLTGNSNSPILEFSITLGSLIIPTPVIYDVNGTIVAENREAIPNDPGATETYTFNVDWEIQGNLTTDDLSSTIVVTADNGMVAECQVIQPRTYENVTANNVNLRTKSNKNIWVTT